MTVSVTAPQAVQPLRSIVIHGCGNIDELDRFSSAAGFDFSYPMLAHLIERYGSYAMAGLQLSVDLLVHLEIDFFLAHAVAQSLTGRSLTLQNLMLNQFGYDRESASLVRVTQYVTVIQLMLDDVVCTEVLADRARSLRERRLMAA